MFEVVDGVLVVVEQFLMGESALEFWIWWEILDTSELARKEKREWFVRVGKEFGVFVWLLF